MRDLRAPTADHGRGRHRPGARDSYTSGRVADLLKATAPPSGVDTGLVIAAPPAWIPLPDAIDASPTR